MLVIGIDPGISGSICFLQDGRIIDVIEMPTINHGNKDEEDDVDQKQRKRQKNK